MQKFYSFGDVRNSQIQQNLYSSTSSMSAKKFYEPPVHEPQYQTKQIPSTYRGEQVGYRDPYYGQNQIIVNQGFKESGKDFQLSPIKQIQDFQQSPTRQRFDYSSMYPVTYQTNSAINQRYQEYSPNTKQNTLVETDSLENSVKKQPQTLGFYQDQIKMMNVQQQQLYNLNESPFQSITYTPSKYNSNRVSVQNSIGIQKPAYIVQQDEISHMRHISPSQYTNKGIQSPKSLSEEVKQPPVFNQGNYNNNVLDNRINKEENKQMYDSIHKNVSQIVDKYFKPLNKQQQQLQNEKLETQSMHQLSNHKSEQLSQHRFNTQTAEGNSPLFSAQRKQNSSNSSIYSQPFDLGIDSQKTYQQNYQQQNPSYTQYISSDTEKILQKWNNLPQRQTINQNNIQNKYYDQPQFDQNANQIKQRQYQNQIHNQQQQIPIQQNIQTQAIKRPELINNQKINSIQNVNSIQNIPSQQNTQQNSQLSLQDQSYQQLNNGFVQTKQQISLQGIPNQNTINNLSNIEKQTRTELDDSESKKFLQNAKLNSFEDFEKPENGNIEQLQTNNNNIIYDSHELFDIKNIKNKKPNNMTEQSEVFYSLMNNSNNQITSPSILNPQQQETSKRNIPTECIESNQEFTLKQIINIPKTIQKTLSNQRIPEKKQKNQSLLIFQIVSCLLILIFFYILLIK